MVVADENASRSRLPSDGKTAFEKTWAFIQRIIGPLVVAAILGLVAGWDRLRSDLDNLSSSLTTEITHVRAEYVRIFTDLEKDIAINEAERVAILLRIQEHIDRLQEFMDDGPRFTKEDGDQHGLWIRENAQDIGRVEREYTREINRLEVLIARLPPPDWQRRILELERQVNQLSVGHKE